MARVRGSKQHNMVIKPHQPHQRWIVGAVALVCLIGVWGVGLLFGQHLERQMQSLQPNDQHALEQLHGQLAELEQGRLVDQVALESARSDLIAKQRQIRQLQKKLAFYKGVLAPGKNAKGLQIDRLGVYKLSASRTFRLKWVLIQAGKNSKYLAGKTTLELVGKLAGVEKVLSLKDVVSGTPNLTFKFRYFQNFSAKIELPDKFVVESVVLSAVVKGNKAQRISQQYNWAVQETLVHVE